MKEKLNKRRNRLLVRYLDKLENRFFVFKSFMGLTFISIAFFFFTPLLKVKSDIAELFLVVFGTFVLFLTIALIVEFVVKVYRLQATETNRFSAILSANLFFGLTLPVFNINLTLLSVIKSLQGLTNYNTFWCDLRYTIIGFYYSNGIYTHLMNLFFILFLTTIFLFVFGGYFEKLRKNR